MHVVAAVVRKDLLRKLRSPLGSVIFLIFPVLFAMLIGFTFGGSGEKAAPIRVALVDDDKALASRFLKSAFAQERMPTRFDILDADLAEANRLIENDKVSAVLRFPPGFTDSLLNNHSTRLEVIKNPAQRIYPQIVEEFVRVLALGSGSAVRVLGGPLAEIRSASRANSRPSEAFIADVSVAMSRRIQGAGRYAIPPAIRLENAEAEEPKSSGGESPFRIALFALPGMAIFSLMMLAIGSMADLPREVTKGTLARQFVAPVRAGSIIVGKIAATWITSIACIAILCVVAAIWSGSDLHPVGFISLSLAFGLAATGFAALIQAISRSERSGSTLGSILVMVMSVIGGSWIPLDSLPRFVRGLAPYTLIYWASAGYRELLFGSGGIASILPNLAVLLACGILFSGVSMILFGRRYRTGA
jgi:ABC-type multidrug transport system permease subunit